MELRREYAEIVEKASYQWSVAGNPAREVFEGIAVACQELADRPPKELTDAEISAAHESVQAVKSNSGNINPYWLKGVRAVIAAHIAKQREPQVVKFRAARCKDGRVEVFRSDCVFTSDLWEWLEPAQEFEVRI